MFKKKTLAVLVTLTFLCAFQAQAGDLSPLIKDTETLYQACKKAQLKYKPSEIGQSPCGSYFQGFLGGAGFAAIQIMSGIEEPDLRMKALNEYNSKFCWRKDNSINLRIADFTRWREKNKNFSDDLRTAIWASMTQDCANKQKFPYVGLEKNGKN